MNLRRDQRDAGRLRRALPHSSTASRCWPPIITPTRWQIAPDCTSRAISSTSSGPLRDGRVGERGHAGSGELAAEHDARATPASAAVTSGSRSRQPVSIPTTRPVSWPSASRIRSAPSGGLKSGASRPSSAIARELSQEAWSV